MIKRRKAIKYGRSISTTIINGLATSKIENIAGGATVSKFTDIVERVPVKDATAIHAEFLKLLDLYIKGGIESIGVQTVDRDHKPQFLDKYWTVREEIKEID